MEVEQSITEFKKNNAHRMSAESKARNTVERLVELGEQDSEALFRDQHGFPHALVAGRPVPLDSSAYEWLRKLYWNRNGKVPKRDDLASATETLAMFASHTKERTVHIRAMQHEGKVYVWLGPDRVVEVSADGWRCTNPTAEHEVTGDEQGWARVKNPWLLFRHEPTLKELPNPEPGGDLNDLDRFIRLKSDRDKRLNKASIVTAYLANIPRPMNLATGPHGGAKTTGQRATKRLLDPTTPEDFRLRFKDFAQNMDNTYIPMFDNVGSINNDLSDELCRGVTGSGNADRRLYSDNKSVVRQYKRAILINGINTPTNNGDFMDRALPLEYERVPKNERLTESELWAEFDKEHPKLLGAVLDALSAAIRLRAPLSEPPRLADWAEYAAAVYEYMGWGREQFMKDWGKVEEAQHETTLEGSPVAQAVRKFMEDKAEYADTPAKLYEELTTVADGMGLNPQKSKEWPTVSNWLWRKIKPAIPTLEMYGIRAEQDTEGSRNAKRRIIRLTKAGDDTGDDKTRGVDPQNSAYLSAGDDTDDRDDTDDITSPPITSDHFERIKKALEDSKGWVPTHEYVDPVDRVDPQAYLSQKRGDDTHESVDPRVVPPARIGFNEIDNPENWREELDSATRLIIPRIFHGIAVPQSAPATTDPTDQEMADALRELFDRNLDARNDVGLLPYLVDLPGNYGPANVERGLRILRGQPA